MRGNLWETCLEYKSPKCPFYAYEFWRVSFPGDTWQTGSCVPNDIGLAECSFGVTNK